MKTLDKLVPKVFEGVVWVLLLTYAAVWDVLISPEWNGIPIPIILFVVLFGLLVFAPFRFEE